MPETCDEVREKPPLFKNSVQPNLIELIKADPQYVNGSLQHKTVGHIEFEACISESFATSLGLLAPFVTEVTVHPTREFVFLIPDGLSVTNKNKSARHCDIKRGS